MFCFFFCRHVVHLVFYSRTTWRNFLTFEYRCISLICCQISVNSGGGDMGQHLTMFNESTRNLTKMYFRAIQKRGKSLFLKYRDRNFAAAEFRLLGQINFLDVIPKKQAYCGRLHTLTRENTFV